MAKQKQRYKLICNCGFIVKPMPKSPTLTIYQISKSTKATLSTKNFQQKTKYVVLKRIQFINLGLYYALVSDLRFFQSKI